MSPSAELVRETMMMMGVAVRHWLSEGIGRQEALQRACDIMMEMPSGGVEGLQQLKHLLATVGGSWSNAWAESGFASLEPSHKLAASLMCTSIPTELVGDIRLPWRCFCIDVPAGLLGTKAPEFVLVLNSHNGLVQTFEVGDQTFHMGFESTLAEYANIELVMEDNGLVSDTQSRLAKLIGRLIIGCCIELDRHRSTAGAILTRNTGVRFKRGEPKRWVFKLDRPVRLDVRDAVRSFSCGNGGRVSVQTLVRGHHKMQPCGPQLMGRKWIHIEPYWRGPEDAPILSRAKQIGEV